MSLSSTDSISVFQDVFYNAQVLDDLTEENYFIVVEGDLDLGWLCRLLDR